MNIYMLLSSSRVRRFLRWFRRGRAIAALINDKSTSERDLSDLIRHSRPSVSLTTRWVDQSGSDEVGDKT